MASRNGPMVAGTDGTDYQHRETIVSQYYIRPPPMPPKGAGYTNGYSHNVINDDPGVHEPGDPFEGNISSYPDTNEFLSQLMQQPGQFVEQNCSTFPLPPQEQAPPPPPQQIPPLMGQPLNQGIDGMIMVPANQLVMVNPNYLRMMGQNPPMINNQLSVPIVGTSQPTPSNDTAPSSAPLENLENNSASGTSKVEDLMLANDYQGMGGPSSIPICSGPFEGSPSSEMDSDKTEAKRGLIDDLYLAPSTQQRAAYNRNINNIEAAQTKSRLKWSIMAHYVLSFFMIMKLMPEILDKLDVFVMELEELYVPKPMIWEWAWLVSIPITFLGLSACKKSSAGAMKNFLLGTLVGGLLPVIIGFVMNFSELYLYTSTKKLKNIQTWNGYPVAVLWYFFLILLTQVHLFELYYSKVLIGAWTIKKKT